ncbi:MAG TPA: YtxH domain-containing protein [Coleofasciculaceae cyanobacterium]
MSKHRSRFTLGFLLGAAAGAAAGVLMAPKSGRSTRQRLRSTLQTSADQLPGTIGRLSQGVRDRAVILSEQARERWGERLARLREAVALGVAATQSAPDDADRMAEGFEELSKTASSPAQKPRQLAYNRIATSATNVGDR